MTGQLGDLQPILDEELGNWEHMNSMGKPHWGGPVCIGTAAEASVEVSIQAESGKDRGRFWVAAGSVGIREKTKIAPSILVSIFLVPSLALRNTNDSIPLDGSVGTQTIHVDALRCMVSIQDTNVLSEWNGIMNYKNALLAVKLFSKMACVLAKMDLAVFPSLDDITQALGKQASGHYPPTRGLTYTVLPSRVKNLAQYGVPVKDLCRAVPTYFAQQQKEGTALAMDPDSCSELQFMSFMGLSICGEIPGL
ncbi:gastrokine-3-like [Onychomys torridus]|uniref:gastrokine-3-like n=1 Tax=Onychomys torridus TaxID=38674 RepID=UPI00167F88C5|nr:gastrokine-3-like [Onychomys torridus]